MNYLNKARYGLTIHNKKDIWVGRSFDLYGEYSESEVQVFKDALKPNSIVVDIGANTGSHTLAFSRLVPNGCVFAFEPEKMAFYTLCGNIALNNIFNTFCFQQAISDNVGTILIPELDWQKTNNFGGLELDKDEDYKKGPHYIVNCNTLDNLNFKADFIKIDIEGMEEKALKGGMKTIEQNMPILYVENDRIEKSESLLKCIHELGYKIFEHDAPMFNPANYYDNPENVFVTKNDKNVVTSVIVSKNLFCYHKSKEAPIDTAKFAMKQVQF